MTPSPERRPYPTVAAPARVYRVSRGNDPIALRPRETITESNPLGGRWDDSYGDYRVLYTADSEEGALRETLQRFVPSGRLLDALAAIGVEPGEDRFDGVGVVPSSWLASRSLGTIEVGPCELVDICHASAIDALFEEKSRRFDVAELLGDSTNVTRQISRSIYNRPEDYAGISSPSKLGSNFRNFAFFEDEKTNVTRARLRRIDSRPLGVHLDVLFDVANALRLRFEGFETALAPASPQREWASRLVTAVTNQMIGMVATQVRDAEGSAFACRNPLGDVIVIRAHDGRPDVEVLVASVENGVNIRRFLPGDDVLAALSHTSQALAVRSLGEDQYRHFEHGFVL